jgi:hypothetical protein
LSKAQKPQPLAAAFALSKPKLTPSLPKGQLHHMGFAATRPGGLCFYQTPTASALGIFVS